MAKVLYTNSVEEDSKQNGSGSANHNIWGSDRGGWAVDGREGDSVEQEISEGNKRQDAKGQDGKGNERKDREGTSVCLDRQWGRTNSKI